MAAWWCVMATNLMLVACFAHGLHYLCTLLNNQNVRRMNDNGTAQGGSPVNLMRLAGRLGLAMGAYYLVRLAFFPSYIGMSVAGLVYVLMLVAAPLVCGLMIKRARDKHLGGVMTFWQGFNLSFLVMIFGGLVEAIAQYFYYRYIDQGRFVEGLERSISVLEDNGLGGELLAQMQAMADNIAALSPIDLAVGNFVDGIFWIFIIALLIGLVLKRNAPRRMA